MRRAEVKRLESAHVPVPARANLPVVSLALAGLVLAALLVLITTHGDQGSSGALLVTVLIANLPGVLASVYSERNSRDTRNGVLEAKMQSAAHLALEAKSDDLEALVIRAVRDAQVGTVGGAVAEPGRRSRAAEREQGRPR